MMRGANVFAWQGQASIFASDPRFAGQTKGAKGVAPLPMPGTRFPGKSISTETKAVQQDKRWKLLGAGK